MSWYVDGQDGTNWQKKIHDMDTQKKSKKNIQSRVGYRVAAQLKSIKILCLDYCYTALVMVLLVTIRMLPFLCNKMEIPFAECLQQIDKVTRNKNIMPHSICYKPAQVI